MAIAQFGLEQRVTVTIPEAIAALGVGRSIVYEAIQQGRLKVTVLGRRKVVVASSLYQLATDGFEGEPIQINEPAAIALHDRRVAKVIAEFVKGSKAEGYWRGTLTDLLPDLELDEKEPLSGRKNWTPQILGIWLSRRGRLLKPHGIQYHCWHSGSRWIELFDPDAPCAVAVPQR